MEYNIEKKRNRGEQKPKINVAEIEMQADLDSIIDIQKNDGFEHSYYLTKERLENLIQRGEKFYLATSGKEAVGFSSIDLEIRAKIHFFSIKKENVNKGIGTKLLTKIISEVRKKGYKKVYVYVEINSPLEKFLIKNGFEQVGGYQNRFGDGKDASILEQEI